MMRTRRTRTWTLSILGTLCLTAVPARGLTGAPIAVSPAADADTPALAAHCPTLSWSGIAGATGYEIQVLERLGDEERLVLEGRVGDGRSWTPSRCLEEGREYAWRVRGVEHGQAPDRSSRSGWSSKAPFRVVSRDSLQDALERVAERMADEGRLTARELDWLRQSGLFDESAARPVQPPGGESVAPARSLPARAHSAGDASVHVADGYGTGVVALGKTYGVYAESFDPAGAVAGRATEGTGQNTGVYGWNKTAVDGNAPAGTRAVGVQGTGPVTGVKGTSVAPLGRAVQGSASFGFGINYGVVGESAATSGTGVEGRATGTADTNYGVWAKADDVDFFANGAGADYGPFTGAHLVRVADDSPVIRPGMLVSVTGAVEALPNGDDSPHLSSTLPTVRLTSGPRDSHVLGAYVGAVRLEPDHPWARGAGAPIAAVNALGEGRLWVTDANGPVGAGDFLTSSAVPGYAQRQTEPGLRSHTVAKAIETVDWATAETVAADGRTYRAVLVAVVYSGG